MPLAKRISAVICVALTSACASVKGAPPSNDLAQPLVVNPSLLGSLPVVAAVPPAAAANGNPVDLTPAAPAASAAPATPAPPATAAVPTTARVVPQQPADVPEAGRVVRPPDKPSKPAVPLIAQTQKSEARNEAAASPGRTAEPQLDVTALKERLRETPAIGVFTKLALKNQMDELLQRFRAHHQSGQRAGVESLRQPYDLLVLKVLACVQEGDPSLAQMIARSREAIWGILADPERFKTVT